jgi:hypothetical protein
MILCNDVITRFSVTTDDVIARDVYLYTFYNSRTAKWILMKFHMGIMPLVAAPKSYFLGVLHAPAGAKNTLWAHPCLCVYHDFPRN